MPLPRRSKAPPLKQYRLPGIAAYKILLPVVLETMGRQREVYLDRLEQTLAARDALGIISTANAYEDYIAAIQALIPMTKEIKWANLPENALPRLASITEEQWTREFSALTGEMEAEAQFKLRSQRAIEAETRRLTEQATKEALEKTSKRQEAEGRQAQWETGLAQRKQQAELADVRQWQMMFGSPQEGATRQMGVLGAFNMADRPSVWQEMAQQRWLMGKFEEWRQASLSQLVGSANWIRRWELQHMPNPYEVEEETPLGEATREVDRVQGEVQRLESLIQYYPPGTAPPESELGQLIAVMPQALATAQENLARWQGTKQELEQSPWSNIGTPVAPKITTPPPAPEKLTELVPQFRTGQPIWKGATVPIPSAQQWRRMLPSEQEMFAGFMDWTSGPEAFADLVAATRKMLPESPFRQGTSWTPARQGR